MRFSMFYSMVFVSDLDKAREFYQGKLGLSIKKERPDIKSIYFDTGQATIGVHIPSETSRHKAQIGRSSGIVFLVPNVAEAVNELSAKGVTFTMTSGQTPERPDKATFVDHDGNEFGLGEQEP